MQGDELLRSGLSEPDEHAVRIEERLPLAGGERASGPYAVGLVRHFLHEALRNVERHAEATRVRVAIQSAGGELRVTVENDGAMPGRNGTGLGLPLVRMGAAEQGGRVSWRALPGGRRDGPPTPPR